MFHTEIKSKYEEDISILVKIDNHSWNYLCECGEARDLTVKEIQNCSAIFISHTHIDHFVNFDTILRHQIGNQRRIIICGPKGIAKDIQSKIQSYTWNLIDANAIIYEIREMVSDNEIHRYEITPPTWELQFLEQKTSNLLLEEKTFHVTGILLDHKTPTLSYLFQEKDTIKIVLENSSLKGGKWIPKLKTAFENNQPKQIITIENETYFAEDLFSLLHIQKGDSVGIIMDHAVSIENHVKIQQHFKNCNTVFIESFYQNQDQEYAKLNYHSYAQKSGEIMRKAKVKNAIPVHFSRKYQPKDIEILISEFTESFNNII